MIERERESARIYIHAYTMHVRVYMSARMRCSGKHEVIANNNVCYLSMQLCMCIKTGVQRKREHVLAAMVCERKLSQGGRG